MKEKLQSILKPLYADMMTKITIDKDEDIVPFCMQWGKNFPSAGARLWRVPNR
jgi:hypothetical protein